MFSERHHTEADRVRCTLGIRRLRAAIACLALAAAPELPATAHQPYDTYMTPFRTPCCGEDDCAPLADGDVSRVRGGFYISSRQEFVPQVDAQGGPDDRFHICTFKGLRMCFLIPPGHGA